jgi:hypothetical protein
MNILECYCIIASYTESTPHSLIAQIYIHYLSNYVFLGWEKTGKNYSSVFPISIDVAAISLNENGIIMQIQEHPNE